MRYDRTLLLRPNAAAALLMVAALALILTGCGETDADEPAAHAGDAAVIIAAHEHENSGETCFICDASKRDKGRLWCKEHSRYEDRCWLCHPELEDKSRLYCNEHGLYEDECFLCHPELGESGGDTAGAHDHEGHGHDEHDQHADEQDHDQQVNGGAASASEGLFCHEHQVHEIECGICQPDLAASLAPGQAMKIRLPSPEAANKVGIQTISPASTEAAPAVQALAETQYNRNTLARVTPLASGVIRAVYADLGDSVEAGDVLVELNSAELAAVKSDYLAVLVDLQRHQQTLEREKRLAEAQIAAQKDLLEAQAAQQAAQFATDRLRQQLVNLGLSDRDIAEIERTRDASAILPVRAPFAGTILARDAVVGETTDVGTPIFTVADLSTRWLSLSIPADQAAQVRVGQIVEAQFAELPGQTVEGRLTWIDTAVDERSRLVRARAEVQQNARQLSVGLYGRARIITDSARPAVLVPQDSLQKHERQAFVFVQEQPDLFQLRKVNVGASRSGSVEILAGLTSNDRVVSTGAFLVMSEFLKSRLGAGCTDH